MSSDATLPVDAGVEAAAHGTRRGGRQAEEHVTTHYSQDDPIAKDGLGILGYLQSKDQTTLSCIYSPLQKVVVRGSLILSSDS